MKSHAQSKLAAFSHAIILALVVLLFAPFVATIPLAALAGVLLATTARMAKPSELLALVRKSKLDALVLMTTLIATVFIDLITAVLLGLVLSLMLSRTRLAKTEV